MILDAGMIENIVDLTEADLILVTVCIITIIIGSITFTGAVIGYVTNYISGICGQCKYEFQTSFSIGSYGYFKLEFPCIGNYQRHALHAEKRDNRCNGKR